MSYEGLNYLCAHMVSKPTIEELENVSAYEKVMTLSYNDLAPFVIRNLKSFAFPMTLIWIALSVSLFLIIWFWPGIRSVTADSPVLTGLAAGLMVVPLLLVPVHEGLHLVPYRLGGARDIRLGADLRQGIIYVTAHRFVAGRRLYSMVALTPFIIITAALIFVILFCSPWWKWVLSLALFAHTTMCAGDAALSCFIRGFRHRKAFTWDDAEAMEAYFYAEKE
jgi:hypothetical protein